MGKIGYLLVVLTLSCAAWGDSIALGSSASVAANGPGVYSNQTQSLGGGTDIWLDLKGNSVSSNPILLILGIPNDTGSLLNASSVSSIELWNSSLTTKVAGKLSPFSGSTGYSSITKHNTFGYAGSFSSGDLYKNFFGISSVTSSNETLSNWQKWDQKLFPALYPPPSQPLNYGIYVYGLTFTGATFSTNGDNYIEVSLPGGLPQGSYAVGYSLDVSSRMMTDNYTPFTTAGIVTSGRGLVPEPTSLLLLGSGLGILCMYTRSRS